MKSFGQIAYEASMTNQQLVEKWENLHLDNQRFWEKVGQAVIDSQWRPISELVRSQGKTIIVTGGVFSTSATSDNSINTDRTHFMYPPEPPKEFILEEKEKIEFKKWKEEYASKNGSMFGDQENVAWQAWQAAKGL